MLTLAGRSFTMRYDAERHSYRYRHPALDERDALLKPLQTQYARAKMTRNKLQMTELTKRMDAIHRDFQFATMREL